MCSLDDYKEMNLGSYRSILESELALWHEYYLPITQGTVLDLGAGAGESAKFFLLHGASKVICFEPDPNAIELLHKNFDNDNRVLIIPEKLDQLKIDIEGAERHMIVETHFPCKWRQIKYHHYYYCKIMILEEFWGSLLRKTARKIVKRFL